MLKPKLALLGFFMLLLLPSVASAQNVYASLAGTITDPAGAVVPGATVAAKNENTGLTRTTVTEAHGTYALNLLPAGTYTLSVTGKGFKAKSITGIVLQVNQQAREDVTLEVGTAQQQVVVQGTVPVLQTETASIGEVVNEQEINQLPMNGRNLNQLALITGAVLPANQTQAEAGSASTVQSFSVAGGNSNTNSFMIDGVANTDDAIDNSSLHPSLEMVQEFQMAVNNYSAEFGQYSGGQVNITTRSGSDKFHGSAFEFARNQAFDAKNFFDLPTQAKPPLSRNQFGGSIGGPIKTNKLFFFFSYEGLRLTQGETGAGTIPTQDMLGGNLSVLLQANNPYTHRVTQLINPATQAPIQGDIITAPSSVGAAIAALFPAPTIPGVTINNYVVNPSLIQNDDTYNLRLDYQMSQNDVLTGRMTTLRETLTQPYPIGPGISPLLGYGDTQPSEQYNAFIGETHVFTPHLINEAKIGFSRIELSAENENSSNVAGKLGITGLDPAAYTSYAGVPSIIIPGFPTLGPISFFPQVRADSTYQITDSLSWVKGSHSMKFGVELVRFQLYQNLNINVRGTFIFTGQYSGYGLADMLLGYPAQTSKLQLPGPLWNYGINSNRSFYALDNWQVSKRLTLNVGLRYELDPPVFYKGGQQAGFNPLLGVIQIPKQTNPSINPLIVPAPIPIPVPIQEIKASTICDEDRTNFAPRIGVAYRPFNDDKTVIRGGYGLFYNQPYTNTSCGSSSMLWQYAESFIGTPPGKGAPDISMSDPFPQRLLTSAFTPTANYPARHPTPRVSQYNVDVERQLAPSVVFEIGYLGSSGVNQPVSLNINQAVLGSGPESSRRPFASLGLLNSVTLNGYPGASNYNGLLLHLEKRTSHGSTFLVNYTYSHAINDYSGAVQNAYDLAANRGSSSTDMRQRFVASYVYQLPFGRGRPLGSHWNRLTDAVLGGWQTAGIFTDQTGFSMTSAISSDNSGTAGLHDRPNVTGSTRLSHRSIAKWFNTAAFSTPPLGQFGDEVTGAIVGPGLVDLDVSAVKNFRIRERINLQFRAELFNSMNHPQFLNPATTYPSATFGVISGAEAGREVQFGLRASF